MISPNLSFLRRLGSVLLAVALLGGCNTLFPSAKPQATLYALDSSRPTSAQTPPRQTVPTSAPTLLVSPTRSASGLDSQRIVFIRQAHTFEYFADSEWVDLPARMLTPLIIATLDTDTAFRAIVATPNSATGELRLDTELLRLQHDFTTQPSLVRVMLRAYLVDNTTRQVLAWREFDETVTATSEDAYGGVVAANRAVQLILKKLSGFCAENSATLTRPGR